VRELQVRTGQPARPLAHLLGQPEAVAHRHQRTHHEHPRPLLHHLRRDLGVALAQHGVQLAQRLRAHRHHLTPGRLFHVYF